MTRTNPLLHLQHEFRSTPPIPNRRRLLVSGPIERAQHGFDRGELDVGIDSGSPAGAAIDALDLDVSDGGSFFPGTEGVLAVMGDLEARLAGGREPVDQGRERAIAFTGEFDRRAIAQQARAAANAAVAAVGLEALQFPRGFAFDV